MIDYEKTYGSEALAGGWASDTNKHGGLISPGQ